MEDIKDEIDFIFLALCAGFVMLMIIGFTYLEVGHVSTNTAVEQISFKVRAIPFLLSRHIPRLLSRHIPRLLSGHFARSLPRPIPHDSCFCHCIELYRHIYRICCDIQYRLLRNLRLESHGIR